MLKSVGTRYLAAGILVACAAGAAVQTVSGDEPPAVLILLDRDALDHGPPPHPIPGEAVNDLIASVGVRDQLPYFAANIGQPLTLLGCQHGSDGWFALTNIQPGWASEPGANDGLENYLLAGPGLGSPDASGNRESLLHLVPSVVPVRAEGLRLLIGRAVCAVVYDNDITIVDSATDLNGPNLGIVAFQVLAVDNFDDAELPRVEVQILDAKRACRSTVTLFAEAASAQP